MQQSCAKGKVTAAMYRYSSSSMRVLPLLSHLGCLPYVRNPYSACDGRRGWRRICYAPAVTRSRTSAGNTRPGGPLLLVRQDQACLAASLLLQASLQLVSPAV
jgi:hypothetical protein